ncbi:hypothetical protein P9239_00165 [Caballeronia sp. LZ062]|uniref:hypothetical protein n=1 Tax=unclassified Caballeronia TaxID=2646786 RepID=UPI0028676393|nr:MULTISPECIES: hypothetical protein [unclassified Caballeronia]MDR5856644.1 hypothetical protein [Caballeronia sp. LZ050]MDR5868770.1 hypothetical protein [Caballeronia sp. LZ062]
MNKIQAEDLLSTADQDAEDIVEAKFGHFNEYNRVHTEAHQIVFQALVAERSPGVPLIDLLAIIEPPFSVLTKARLH